MTELPFEILRLISQFLKNPDLLQLQLVNKPWHEASIESLYSQVTIRDVRDERSYIQAISNSRKLGSYLKTIRVKKAFSSNENRISWDQNNLLSVLVKYCFNLQSINAPSSHHVFWTRLILAANQGQLPNLQILPDVDDESIESYVCAALAFRKSLNKLDLVDHVSELYQSDQKINIKAFKELLDHINEFPNIKYLSIIHCNNQPFSHIVNSLIDDCPHLIELTVVLRKSFTRESATQESVTQDVLAIPRPHIRKLICDWRRICKDDQLRYIMRKFPNLKYLDIEAGFTIGFEDMELESYVTSYDVTMDFIKYISSIKKINFAFACERKYMINYWSTFKKLRKTKALEIVYISYFISEDNSSAAMHFSENATGLTYLINSTSNVIPHEEFLCEHGDGIKRLSIDYTSSGYLEVGNTSSLWHLLSNENWIYQILRSCPSLQELKFEDLVEFKLPANNTYQHTELKKLEIKDEEEITSLRFLRYLSFHVPNLKELQISSCRKIDNEDGYRIKIEMPYTSFDSITIKFNQNVGEIEDYYIQLDTIMEEKYYFINSTGKHNLSYVAYEESKKHCLFEITCSGLKQFELIRHNSSYTNELKSIQTF